MVCASGLLTSVTHPVPVDYAQRVCNEFGQLGSLPSLLVIARYAKEGQ